uniref:Uncharacterized protein n=1 Tax=Panagrolaimus sp. PS1159 TaxID=55785 RepID=A0AC35GPY0_9BILA
MRGSLPVVPCTNSVCVKLIIEETYSGRAVCASESGPVIIRDCWSRVLGQENNPIKPTNTKPVRLANPTDISKTIGHILTCEGYLCNHGITTNNQISCLKILTCLFVIFIYKLLL